MRQQYRTFILSIMLISSFACKAPETEIKAVITVDDASVLLSEDPSIVVLDVRTPEEYAMGHIGNSINIDISTKDFLKRVAQLDRDQTYLVHCAANVSNGRAEKSLSIMNDLEFRDLLDLEGGFVAWQESGYPVAKGK